MILKIVRGHCVQWWWKSFTHPVQARVLYERLSLVRSETGQRFTRDPPSPPLTPLNVKCSWTWKGDFNPNCGSKVLSTEEKLCGNLKGITGGKKKNGAVLFMTCHNRSEPPSHPSLCPQPSLHIQKWTFTQHIQKQKRRKTLVVFLDLSIAVVPTRKRRFGQNGAFMKAPTPLRIEMTMVKTRSMVQWYTVQNAWVDDQNFLSGFKALHCSAS